MTRVAIGIPVHEEPEGLLATLESIRANTELPYELILLPDGPDEATASILATLTEFPQHPTTEPHGGPACFNRLVRAADTELVVLLESGARVGPSWLDYLLAALDADPRHGLAGPSTNAAWNEQGAFPRAGLSSSQVAQTAAEAARRFGAARRTLGPLYSLGDFCYAVRRTVFDAIGPADEGYALGPCWEMDYNVRAARAGFQGVWVCASYVARAPFTPRRRREEALRFDASKQRYQDKFCGARRRGERSDYRPHCWGDACPNFAPTTSITLAAAPAERAVAPIVALPEKGTGSEPPGGTHSDIGSAGPMPAPFPDNAVSIAPEPDTTTEPLVSCIMPTYNRRAYIRRSIQTFLRQNYPRRELIIVDDGEDAVADCLPDDPRIRYIRRDPRSPVGAKRNLACAEAKGEIIVHWDDDDWYPPGRIRMQVRALLDRGADVCGTSRLYYYDAASGRAWRYEYAGRSAPWVAGNTLAYRRAFWERNRFHDLQVGEDTHFLWSRAPKVLHDLADPSLCVASLHVQNTARKEPGGPFWYPERVELLRAWLDADPRAPADPPGKLVSCIMPTRDRRPFVALALERFRSQDYPNRELLIVDNGIDSVADLAENVPGVRYLRTSAGTTIGAKRNQACREAQGEFIAHWDDDDWYAPDRLSRQLAPLLENRADITGLECAYVLTFPTGAIWRTTAELHHRMFYGDVHGGTLVFRKSIFEQGLRYPEINLAEDAHLLYQAFHRGQRLLRLSNDGSFVYVRHGHNAWAFDTGQFLDPTGWQTAAPPPNFADEVREAYRLAAAQAAAHR